MKVQIDHISINVSDFEKSKRFYKEFFNFIGWKKFREEEGSISWVDKSKQFFIWLDKTEEKFKQRRFHRKNIGVNHIAFKVDFKQEVDDFFSKFLKDKKEITLYGGPKEYPKYTEGYYAVYFEDPDRIKLEVMFVPEDK